MKKYFIILLLLLILPACSNTNYLESILLGSEWFLNNQNEDFLYYEYDPFSSTYFTSNHKLREMGGLWAITYIADFLNDERYDQLAQKGLTFFEPYFKEDVENDFYYVEINSESKLGYSAFMILSIINIEHELKDVYLEKLAKGIVYQQQEDGSLNTYFNSVRNTGVDYYPGEALVALMSLYEYNGNEVYLETTEKAFPYYSDYWRDNKNTAFVPWQTRAYYKLYQANENEKVKDFVFEMNDYILSEHNPEKECKNFQYSGSVSGVYLEGVNFAYDLAQRTGDKEREKCYKNFIEETADFLLTLQFPVSNEFPIEAWGGFIGSETSTTLRVDRNQHCVMALIDSYNLGLI